jgi:hypothetical protein
MVAWTERTLCAESKRVAPGCRSRRPLKSDLSAAKAIVFFAGLEAPLSSP